MHINDDKQQTNIMSPPSAALIETFLFIYPVLIGSVFLVYFIAMPMLEKTRRRHNNKRPRVNSPAIIPLVIPQPPRAPPPPPSPPVPAPQPPPPRPPLPPLAPSSSTPPPTNSTLQTPASAGPAEFSSHGLPPLYPAITTTAAPTRIMTSDDIVEDTKINPRPNLLSRRFHHNSTAPMSLELGKKSFRHSLPSIRILTPKRTRSASGFSATDPTSGSSRRDPVSSFHDPHSQPANIVLDNDSDPISSSPPAMDPATLTDNNNHNALGGRMSPEQSSVAYTNSTGSSFRFTAATKNAECPICFDFLYKEWTSVCVDKQGMRTCDHFYHERCLRTVHTRTCVLCKARFDYRRRVPNLEENPIEWFKVVDSDGSGALDRQELINCLRAQIPIDMITLEQLLNREWHRWDKDGSGSISLAEFFHPRSGLLAYLRKKRSKLRLSIAKREAPDIRDDLEGWFDHWDGDHSGELDKDEVVRGLVKSFGLSSHTRVAAKLHDVLDAVWPVFDKDGSGAIDREEFLAPKDGLGAAIIASLMGPTAGL